jgi:hypothetical protein
MEKDLSTKKQLLDLVILRKKDGQFKGSLPDGFDSLADYNLITFKSIHEPLDDWAVTELVSYYVNYRKFVSDDPNSLEPQERFQLYAIGTRFPQKLAKLVNLKSMQWKGVYELSLGVITIKVIVLSKIEKKEHNALWLLFSGEPEKISYGASNWQDKSEEINAILNQLFTNYQMEGVNMPYTMEQFKQDTAMEYLHLLSPAQVLSHFSVEDLLKGLPAEERLRGLPAEEVLRRFPPEERLMGLTPEEILERLTPETIMNYLSKVRKE